MGKTCRGWIVLSPWRIILVAWIWLEVHLHCINCYRTISGWAGGSATRCFDSFKRAPHKHSLIGSGIILRRTLDIKICRVHHFLDDFVLNDQVTVDWFWNLLFATLLVVNKNYITCIFNTYNRLYEDSKVIVIYCHWKSFIELNLIN